MLRLYRLKAWIGKQTDQRIRKHLQILMFECFWDAFCLHLESENRIFTGLKYSVIQTFILPLVLEISVF